MMKIVDPVCKRDYFCVLIFWINIMLFAHYISATVTEATHLQVLSFVSWNVKEWAVTNIVHCVVKYQITLISFTNFTNKMIVPFNYY